MKSEARIASLDGLRAVSILMVIIGHVFEQIAPHFNGPLWLFYLLDMIGHRMLGVAIFFGISGFLITRLLILELRREGRISIGNFYIRRAFRILPAFYTFLVFVAALVLLGKITIRPSEFAIAGLFVWDYVHPPVWWLGHTWSLSVEEQFYIFWPTLLFLSGPKRALKICTALILASPFIRVGFYLLFPSWRDFISILLHTRLDALMCGCFVALVYDDAKWKRILAKVMRTRLHLVAFALLFCVTPFLIARFGGKYLLPVGYTFESATIALLIYWAIENSGSFVGRILNSRVMAHIGVLSYSLYLWQQVFIYEPAWTWWQKFPENVVVIFAMASLSYYLVEKPFLRLRRRFMAPSLRPRTEPAFGLKAT